MLRNGRGSDARTEYEMNSIDSLAGELAHEAQTTRRYLERLPGGAMDWRPHPKSFTAGALASHIVECVRWTQSIFSSDELNFDPATHRPFLAGSASELLDAFDDAVASSLRALEGAVSDTLLRPWRLKIMGKVRFEKPRVAVFRDFTLSHLIHHRGQLSVYLRLLDVPVPGAYGPSADEA
jgi:uncharacterized damage-inducible protein DinB